MITQKELNEMLFKAMDEIETLGINVKRDEIIPEIRISNATTFFGICKHKPRGYEISISKYHLANPKNAVYQTVVHEVLHTIEGCCSHDKKWQALANKVSRAYGYNISRLGTAKSGFSLNTPKSVYKYIFECKDCGSQVKRQKKSKLVTHTENYKCGICGGKFKRV